MILTTNDTSRTCAPDCWLKLRASPTTSHISITPTRRPDNVPKSHRARLASVLYTPLKSWQTRVLRLESGSIDQPLQACLLVVDMILYEGVVIHNTQSLISYTALSYAWGPPQYTEVLIINNCTYPITASLAAALRCLRDSRQYKMLWVDAVCINQHDDEERSAQVSIMLSIYQKAEHVIAWLSPSTATITFTFDVVENLYHDPARISTLEFHGIECINKLVAVENDLREIFSQPWFRRTWVRQEVFGARHLTAQYGTHCVPRELWPEMQHCFHVIQETLVNVGVYSKRPDAEVPVLLTELRSSGEAPPVVGLFQTLTTSAHFQESDPKDKVYAILGMTGTPTRDGAIAEVPGSNKMIVDYRRTVTNVYQDVTKYLINHHRSLSVLYLQYPNTKQDPQLPSWTPDWRTVRPENYMKIGVLNIDEQEATSSLLQCQDELSPPLWQDSSALGILRLEGFLIYVIERLSTVSFYTAQTLRNSSLDPGEFRNATLDIADSLKWALYKTEIPVPRTARCGDCVVILSGHSFVLRPDLNNEYQFIGATLHPALSVAKLRDASFSIRTLRQQPGEVFLIK